MAARRVPPSPPEDGQDDAPDMSIIALGKCEEYDVVATTQKPDQWLRYSGPLPEVGGRE